MFEPADLVIEPFTSADSSVVVAVVRSVFDEYDFTWDAEIHCADLYDPIAHYVRPGGQFFVARVNGIVVGCCGVSLHDGYGELHRMYLIKSQRGLGIGRKLLDVCIDFVKTHGRPAMRIWSDVKLPDAHRLYLKNGFERRGERETRDPDDTREYGFWKEPL